MSILIILIPITLCLGIIGLIAFLWNLKSGQYNDLEGAANRILFDQDSNDDKNQEKNQDGPKK
jgi:cbb3-type cytochrome oxidase maturation protein